MWREHATGQFQRTRAHKTPQMDVDRYPAGSRVEVWWPNEKEWYSATVLKTRATAPHMTDGSGVICQELFCYYDLDDHIQWHSLHDNDVRLCTSPITTEDDRGVADPFAVGTRVQVWWPGDSSYYIATVLKTRVAWHSIKRLKTLCREIFCEYDLDGLMQWHSLHNNKVHSASGTSRYLRFPCTTIRNATHKTHKINNDTRDKPVTKHTR